MFNELILQKQSDKHAIFNMDKLITHKAYSETQLETSKPQSDTQSCVEQSETSPEISKDPPTDSPSQDDPCVDKEERSTPKSSKKKNYMHKYRSEWETNPEFKNWIQPSTRGNTYFKCKICVKDYIGGTVALRRHMSSKKHQDKMTAVTSQPTMIETFNTEPKNATKKNEIRLAAFIVEHNISISVIDHLVDLFKQMQKDVKHMNIDKLSCNRTKCTTIINNVTGKSSFNALVDTLRINKFALLVDESTDHSTVKHLALIVRLNIDFQIQDKFLALVEVKDASAQNLYNVIVNFFEKNNIPYKQNMIAFAADGAHAIMGRNHSLKTLLTNDIPHLFVIKCVCHSLALCASHACANLPDGPEKLVRNIYTYMKYSFKRQSEFKDFQAFLGLKPHKLLQPVQTRWLSLQLVVERVLEQYEALVLYFRAEQFDKISSASEIYEELMNPTNKLYLEFLKYVLPIFNNLNLEFQSESPKIYLLYDNVENTYRTLLSYYIDPKYLETTDITQIQYRNPRNYITLDKIYCGPKISLELQGNNLSNEEKKNFRLKCMAFYVTSCHEIYKRFPFNSFEMSVLKLFSFLNPDKVNSTETLANLSAKMPYLVTDINILDREWRSIINMPNKPKTKDIITYWKTICEKKKGDESLAYPEINKLVSYILTLPHSSASVERIFSAINLNKTKVRNRLGTETLSGILHTKRLVNENGKNCFNFDIDSNVLKYHNKMMY